VLAQSPPANATQVAEPNISLLLTAPADPQAFVMPSFIGQPLGTVSRTLQDAGFRLGNVSVAAPAPLPTVDAAGNPVALPVPVPVVPVAPPAQPSPASIIVSQVPGAGQRVVAGTMVSFEVK
jgi:beta-lactam-binding protein with PASTA domain